MSNIVEVRRVSLAYGGIRALNEVSLEVRRGEMLAIMGPNASGKSTLALIMNGLLIPDSGHCLVDGISTTEDCLRARQMVGLVFQDPEDQAVYHKVEDDVAFGPKNIGAPDRCERVTEALRLTGIEGLAGRDINTLSGGQRQLVAIAGVLAMRPSCLILDEPTSFLDQDGASMVSNIIDEIKKEGRGMVVITHDPALAAKADRIAVMDQGSIVLEGEPDYVFSAVPDGLIELPEMVRLALRLRARGMEVNTLLSVNDMAERLCR